MSAECSQTIRDIVIRKKINAGPTSYSGSLLAELASQEDLLEAQKTNLDNKKKGDKEKNLLQKDKDKMSAGRLVLEYQSHHLGQSVLEQARYVQSCKQEVLKNKKKYNTAIYKKMLKDAHKVREKHKNK